MKALGKAAVAAKKAKPKRDLTSNFEELDARYAT
jgi:hypothetical protein